MNLGQRKLEAARTLANAYVYLTEGKVRGIKSNSAAWWGRQHASRIIMDEFYALLKMPMYDFCKNNPANRETK